MAGDTFMPEMHLKQSGFTYGVCCPFTKNKERIERRNWNWNSWKQEIQIMPTKMTLIKLAFNIIWLMVNIKIWIKEHSQIKFEKIKVLKLQVIQKYDGFQRGLASMV